MRQIPHPPVSLLLITSDVRIFISPILRISGNFPRTLFFTAPFTTENTENTEKNVPIFVNLTVCIVYTINCALSSEKFPPRKKKFTTKQPKEAPILSGAPRHQENISGFIYNSLCLCVLVVNRSVKEKRRMKNKKNRARISANPAVQISSYPDDQLSRCLFRDFDFDEKDFAVAYRQRPLLGNRNRLIGHFLASLSSHNQKKIAGIIGCPQFSSSVIRRNRSRNHCFQGRELHCSWNFDTAPNNAFSTCSYGEATGIFF